MVTTNVEVIRMETVYSIQLNSIQDSQSIGRDFKLGPTEYEAVILPAR
jgi:hypothetical protein